MLLWARMGNNKYKKKNSYLMVAKLAKETKMRGRQSLGSGLRKRVTAYTDQSSIHGNEHYIRVNIIARMEYLPIF